MTPFVVPHDPEWSHNFASESGAIHAALGDGFMTIHHIGSTSIPDILAKPIIDMLGQVETLRDMDSRSDVLVQLGYEAMGSFGIEGRRYFRKTSPEGARTHHLHVFARGSPDIERHLAFRDYLRHFPDIAAHYSRLKAELTQADEASWEDYMDGKAPFIGQTEAEALIWYRARMRSSKS